MTFDELKEKALSLPYAPGVYIMRDKTTLPPMSWWDARHCIPSCFRRVVRMGKAGFLNPVLNTSMFPMTISLLSWMTS